MYYFSTHHLNAIYRNKHRIIFGTGASMSATSDKCLLKNIIPYQDVEASSAFGKLIQPKLISVDAKQKIFTKESNSISKIVTPVVANVRSIFGMVLLTP